jgi:hypothetical protein
MTAVEFTKIIGLIRGAFPRMDRFGDADVKDVWFECMEDLEYDRARKATLNTIKVAKDFPPDIATIREEYARLLKIENEEEAEIRKYYDYARAYYPGSGEPGNGWKEFRERVKTVEEADRLQRRIIAYVSYMEQNTSENVMPFVECIQTVKL